MYVPQLHSDGTRGSRVRGREASDVTARGEGALWSFIDLMRGPGRWWFALSHIIRALSRIVRRGRARRSWSAIRRGGNRHP
jgi:hypothetical protein